MSQLPQLNARITVHTKEVRGIGTVTEVNDRWAYVRVIMDSGLKCSVGAGEWRVVETRERVEA